MAYQLQQILKGRQNISNINLNQDMLGMKVCMIVFAVLLLARPSSCLSLNKHDDAYTGDCKCPAGYTRTEVDCRQNCPAGPGWADHGFYCRLVEYGRGVGYGWQITDGLSNSGMFSRCEKDNGQGNCEQNGAIVYPKCKPGYSPVGCCICRPNVPNCKALGYNDNVDLSCLKKLLCLE